MSSLSNGYSIHAPQTIENPISFDWSDSADLVIVGFGVAGAAAALEAANRGFYVLVLDRFSGGGASRVSGGIVYAGGGTHIQSAAGINDSLESMFNYLKAEVQGVVSDETLKLFCAKSAENLAWLEQFGVKFLPTLAPKKTSYPEDQFHLYYSGSELSSHRTSVAKPAPRGHRAAGPTVLSGQYLYDSLHDAVINHPKITVRTLTAVDQLLTNPNGHVIGVSARSQDTSSLPGRLFSKMTREADKWHTMNPFATNFIRRIALLIEEYSHRPKLFIRAKSGVVLATGGFIFNRQMVKKYLKPFQRNLPIGSLGCDGSGIRLGCSLGAQIAQMQTASAWRFINPPSAWIKGILVNRQGQRFIDESMYGAALGSAIATDQGGQSWLIIDQSIVNQSFIELKQHSYHWFQRIPAWLGMKFFHTHATDIITLARKLSVNADNLTETIAKYNQAAANNADVFGKNIEDCHQLQPPYFAIDVSNNNPWYPAPVISLGGLKVNEKTGAVLHKSGAIIPGLYAAGRAAVGVASNNYISGLSLADCIFSGRRISQSMTSP